MLLLKTIYINPWKEKEDGEGVHFWSVWDVAAAIATGAKGGARDTRRILWKTSQAHLSLFSEDGCPFEGFSLIELESPGDFVLDESRQRIHTKSVAAKKKKKDVAQGHIDRPQIFIS